MSWHPTASTAGPAVLLVEDHADTREMYADCLGFAGSHVLTTSDADAGFDLAVMFRPAVRDVRALVAGERLTAWPVEHIREWP